mgnify:CR=1 FL=1
MVDFNTSKVDGNTVAAVEWNQLTDIDNFVITSGQAPSSSDLNQLGIASARYSSGGQFYTDSGTANTYVLSPVSPFKAPVDATNGYFTGMTIRFRAGNANTGASTVNVNSAGVKNLKQADGVTDLNPNQLSSSQFSEFVYDGTAFRFVNYLPLNYLFSPSYRNKVINGSFDIWQRGTSFTSIADAAYSADRFQYAKSGSMVHDITRSTDVPTIAQAGCLFNYSVKIDCQTVDSSISSGEYCSFNQPIEGFNWLPLAQKSVTLSFWVKATKTGTYCVRLSNSGSDRSCVMEYSVSTTNTWEKKTVTFPASPSAGTWNYTNGIGATLGFTLAAGSTIQTTAGAWQSGIYIGTSNQVNACDSTSNDFYLTGIQLEEGSVATPFESQPIQDILLLCQRYYEKSYDYGTVAGTATSLGQVSWASISGSGFITNANFKTVKRSTPTMVIYSPNTGTSGKIYSSASGDLDGGTASIGDSRCLLALSSAAPSTSNLSVHFTANSEL